MVQSLPPLTAIRAFESAGRHLSFTEAAAELNVTPAAISHQVKALEEYLNVELFHRRTRALELTEAGQAALPILNEGFEKLAQGIAQTQAHRESNILSISINPSFGAMWLIPRLDRFRKQHPDIEIRIDATDSLADLVRDNVDVAVRCGPGGYSGVRIDCLFNQVNTPVCSPALLSGSHPLLQPDDLRHHTLLHVDWKDEDPSWRMWLLAAGLHHIEPSQGLHFTMEDMAVQAALNGQGVALIGDILVADHVAAGHLVQPFDPVLNTPLNYSYYLLCKNNSDEPAKVTYFREWLLEEAKNSYTQSDES